MTAPSLEVMGTPLSERHGDVDILEPSVVPSSFTPIKSHMTHSIDTILCAGKCVFVVCCYHPLRDFHWNHFSHHILLPSLLLAEALNRHEDAARFHAYYGTPIQGKDRKKEVVVAPTKNQLELARKVDNMLSNKRTYRFLLLSLTLNSRPHEKDGACTPPTSRTIGKNFFWNQYPDLEALLFDEMPKYYANQIPSKQQKTYNNKLLATVRNKAEELGYSFDRGVFDDKKLRNRIRCFYKSHIQNAKKRILTMKKNIFSSPAQYRALEALICKAQGFADIPV